MIDILAYECFADHDVFLFLRETCGLPIRKRHSESQGEVINDVFKKEKADFGMVDEDPHSSHHRLRDMMQGVSKTIDLELRRMANRHLVLVKPDLEFCFRRCMGRVGLESELPTDPRELHRALGIPNPRHPIHIRFRQELGLLHQESRRRPVATFVTELEDIVRNLPPPAG